MTVSRKEVLRTGRLVLTLWLPSDVEALFEGHSDEATMRFVRVALRHSLSIGQGPKTAVLLLLFLFLPLRSRWIIPAALLLTIRLVSNNPAFWGLAYHYNSILSTLLASAALDAAKKVFVSDRAAPIVDT